MLLHCMAFVHMCKVCLHKCKSVMLCVFVSLSVTLYLPEHMFCVRACLCVHACMCVHTWFYQTASFSNGCFAEPLYEKKQIIMTFENFTSKLQAQLNDLEVTSTKKDTHCQI